MLKDLPRYECLLEASREFPDLDPSATEVFLHLLRAGDEAFRVVESHLALHDITQGRELVPLRYALLVPGYTGSKEDFAPMIDPIADAYLAGVSTRRVEKLPPSRMRSTS